jgi:hypothetical protein
MAADLYRERIPRHLEPPALQPVALAHRHQVEVTVKEFDRVAPAGHVERAAPPRIGRGVVDLDKRHGIAQLAQGSESP